MTTRHITGARNLAIFSQLGFFKQFYCYIPVLTLFLLAQNISLSHIVFASTFWSLSSFLGEVPTGLFADRYGHKLSMMIGYLGEAFGVLMIWWWPSLVGLYIASSIQGLASSCISGSEEALLFESTKHTPGANFQKHYGSFLSHQTIGFVVATVGAGLVYATFGVRSFPFLIGLTALCLVIAAFLSSRLRTFASRQQLSADGSLFTTLRQSFRLIRTHKTISTLTIVTMITIPGEYFLLGVYQPYFEMHHVPTLWIGGVLALGGLLNAGMSRFVYILEKYCSLHMIIFWLTMAMSLGYVALAILVHPAFLVGLYCVMQGIMNLETPIIADSINQHTPTAQRATVLSGVSFFKRFADIFLLWILGSIVGIGGITTGLIAQAGYLTLGAIISFFLLTRLYFDPKARPS